MDKLLLDSHALLWWTHDHASLAPHVRKSISEAKTVYYSAASLWELTIKSMHGKLGLPPRFIKGLAESELELLPILGSHVLSLQSLPSLHKDPFDRMLVAQALAEDCVLVTRDRAMREYPITTLPI